MVDVRPDATPVGTWHIRPVAPDDVDALHGLVRALATYERHSDAVVATPGDLRSALFGPNARVHCHVAEVSTDTGPVVAGLALWFVSYSTWRGRHGIWLEDLFVLPEHRGLGLGKALLRALARECTERGYARLEWSVLDWNTPAIDVYRAVGANPQDEWTTWRLDGAHLTALAGLAPSDTVPAGGGPGSEEAS